MAQKSTAIRMEGSPGALPTGRSLDFSESTPTGNPRIRLIVSRAIVGFAILLLLATAGLYAFRSSYSEKIYPSVFVSDVPVGGLTYAEAAESVERRAAKLTASRANLSFDDLTWTPTLAELGVIVEGTTSTERAYAVGREGAARDRLRSAYELGRGDISIPLKVSVDDEILIAWFDSVDAQLGPPPHDAQLVVTNGKVSIIDDVEGTVVDRAAAASMFVRELNQLRAPSGTLPTIAKRSRVHAEDLATARVSVERALSKPVTLTFDDQRWSLNPADLGKFIVTDIDTSKQGKEAVRVRLDKDALTGWLTTLVGDGVSREPVNAVVAWGGDGVGAIASEPSISGTRLQPEKLAAGVIASFFGNHGSVTVPTRVIPAEIDSDDVESLGITTRLATGDSNFDGSDEGRITNILVGASLLNGTLIPPHSEFSFNHAIGEITVDKGYVESQVIDGERIARDIGGGICQVSTTMFRAAFLAGLPITEWHPHRYRLGFYEYDSWEPGLDASILQPEGNPFAAGGDFAFSNPSDSWMLIEAFNEGPYIYIRIYGADLGYDVEITGPEMGEQSPATEAVEVVNPGLDPGTFFQTEWAGPGLIVSYARRVTDRSGSEIEDDIYTTSYSARGDVWTVSPDMVGQSPARRGDSGEFSDAIQSEE